MLQFHPQGWDVEAQPLDPRCSTSTKLLSAHHLNSPTKHLHGKITFTFLFIFREWTTVWNTTEEWAVWCIVVQFHMPNKSEHGTTFMVTPFVVIHFWELIVSWEKKLWLVFAISNNTFKLWWRGCYSEVSFITVSPLNFIQKIKQGLAILTWCGKMILKFKANIWKYD